MIEMFSKAENIYFCGFLFYKTGILKIYHGTENIPPIKSAVVTVGTFDGLHLGHQKIIARMKEIAKRLNGETVLVTFSPHPRRVLYEDSKDLKLILTDKKKYELLEKFGIDHLIVIPFTKEFAKKSPAEFVKEILVKKTGMKYYVIGYDHRFGKGRGSTYEEIMELARQYGFEVEKVDAVVIDGITVSSTKIRQALKEGNIRLANKMLGFEYSITGKVVEGDKIGRTLGYPTANLEISDEYKLIAAKGVYACRVERKGKMYYGMGNIGYRPTINGNKDLRTEVHIFDFNEMIYGEEITVYFVDRIRDEKKFKNLDELKKQLQEDEKTVRRFFQLYDGK